MKYEINEKQMEEFVIILNRLHRLETVFSHANGAGFLRETKTRLYGLLQRIEMQDLEDAT